jgi:hypothetical protein
MVKPTSAINSASTIRLITKMLTPAIKLWLRTQLSQVSVLEVEIQASDRQILSGIIPRVSIFASNAVYQGLHLTQIELTAEKIHINIGAILRGKSLRLLETVPVIGELIVSEQDLNNCLLSNLLSTALKDVLVKLLPEEWLKSKPINWEKISLKDQRIHLYGVQTNQDQPVILELTTGLELLNGQELQLAQLNLLIGNQAANLENDFVNSIYLGSEIDLQELQLTPSALICRGRINVNP